jgi:cyclase
MSASPSVDSARDNSPDAARVEEVGKGVYAYIQPDGTWWINNAGFLAGDRRTVLVDTCATERRTRRLLATARATTGSAVTTVVNTHHHGDHTYGNYLTGDAVVIGHEKCRDMILKTGVLRYEQAFHGAEWGELELRAPEVTFTDSLTIHAGDTRVELHYVGNAAHTTNDIVLWLPESGVLFTGDIVFNGGTPFTLMGSVAGGRAALEFARSFGARTLVPGHGEICGPEAIDAADAYLAFVQRTAEAAAAAGLTPLDAARQTDLGEFAALTDPERLVANLHRAYAEQAGQEWGAPMDIPAIIKDMLVFNGGPIRCFA